MQEMGGGVGYVKAGMFGFGGTGKTFSATLLGVAIKRLFKLKGRIAIFDTEPGAQYVNPIVKALTGEYLLGEAARSFSALLQFAKECDAADHPVVIIDNVTHPWRELCDSYLDQVNKARVNGGKSKLARLGLNHWQVLKRRWAEFSDWFVTSPRHIIICGRAGYEWEHQLDDQTNQKELVKTGTKMKTEGEMAFEPSLLVELTRQREEKDDHVLYREAIVTKDRFGVLDGRRFEFHHQDDPEKALAAVYEAFKPHLEMLTPGARPQVDTEEQTDMQVDSEGRNGWAQEKRHREILAEEIKGVLLSQWPGQSAVEKKAKTDTLQFAFGTRSWAKVEQTDSQELRNGLDDLKVMINKEYGNKEKPHA